MSVINKMLRDLDASARPRDAVPGQPPIVAGTVPVAVRGKSSGVKSSRAPVTLLAAMAAAVAMAGGVAVWWWLNAPSRPSPVSVVPVPGTTANRDPAPVAATVPVVAPTHAPASAPAMVLRPSAQPGTVNAGGVGSAGNNPATAALAAGPPAPAPAPPVTTVRSSAPTDLLEDAQRLWDKGARETAVQLLREKVDAGNGLALAGGSSAAFWLWVSELTRMEVALGLSQEALQRLVRLESVLSANASAWATRGNLAQRLGRHGESAQAYLAALAIRPDEPRWMLGAAVSLAADGRSVQAAEWAKRVQARGAMNPEIAAFLRQQGVVLP